MATASMDLESLVVRIIGDARSFDSVIAETQKKIKSTTAQIKQSARQVEAEEERLGRLANQLLAASIGPVDRFNMATKDLWKMLKSGTITTDIYRQSLAALEKTLPENVAATRALAKAEKDAAAAKNSMNASLQKGNAVLASFTPQMGRYAAAVHKLNMHLRAGRITNEGYEKRLASIQRAARDAQARQDDMNRALQRGAALLPTLTGPLTGYQVTLNGLNRMLRDGAISVDVYNQRLTTLSRTAANTLRQQQALQNRALGITREHHTPEQMYHARRNDIRAMSPYLTEKLRNKLIQDNTQDLANNARALQVAGIAEGTAAEAQRLHNEYTNRANQLIEQGMTARQRYNRDLQDLVRLYHGGYLGIRQYEAALRSLNQRNQFFLQTLNRIGFQMRVISSGLSRFGAGLRTVGMMSSMFVTAPLTGFAAAGVHELMAFDKAMTYSLSIADNVTPQLRKQMEDLATTFSEKTAHSATELAGAYYELISAGLDAQTSMKALKTVSMFAVAGNMELASSVKHLAQATAAMGLSEGTATEKAAAMHRVANVLAQAANMTTGSIADMTQALVNGAAPQAKILNMQLEDTVAVLMHYIQVGESAAESSEHFAIGMRLLGTAFSENEKFWRQQKLDIYDAQDRARKFTDVLRDMQKIYLNLSTKGQVPFLKALGFEARQQRALNPLLTDPTAADKIDAWSETLKKAGVLEEIFRKQMESLTNQFKVFRNTLANVAREVGLMLMPYLQKSITIVKILVGHWRELSTEGKRLVVIGAAIAAAIGPLIAAMGTAATLAAAAVGGLSALVTAIVAVGLPIAAAAAGFMILAGAMAAVGAYSIALQMWPEETKKVMTVLERMWHAFEGFMASVFDKIFTVDMVVSFFRGAATIAANFDPLTKLLSKAFSGADVRDDAEKFAQTTAKEIQKALDRAGGALDLGSRLSIIIAEELGGVDIADKIKKEMEKNQGESDILENAKKAYAEMQNMGKGQGFSKLSEELNEVNDRLKEMLALEEEQAKRGYDRIDKMTTAEKELFKAELKIAEERQAIADRYDKQIRDQMLRGNIDFLHPQKTKEQALREYDQQNEAVLREMRSRTALVSTIERERLRRQELQAILDRDPAKKIAKQMKDLNDAYMTGEMSVSHYRKELAALRSEMSKEFRLDFKVGGVNTLEHGTAEARAALEEFVRKQQEALRPLPTPEQLMSGNMPSAPKLPGYSTGQTKKSNLYLTPGMSPEMKRLAELANTSGPIAAEARRKLRQMGVAPAQLKGAQYNRLLEMSKLPGLIGADARRRLAESHGVSSSNFGGDEIGRLQGLAEKGGRVGFYAKQKLKEMGKPFAAGAASGLTASSAASRGVEFTQAQKTEKNYLKEIAANTAKTAKKKEVVVEPANL